MTSVCHVSPRHMTFYLPSNLMVEVFPRRSIDPWLSLLRNSGLQSLPTPHIVNPPKSQVSGLSDLAPCVLYLSTVEIHFVVRDFESFHTLKTLGQVPLEYQVSDYRISCHVASHPMALVQWTTFDRGPEGATCRSMTCSRLVGKLRGVLNIVLRSTVERDIEGSEDRRTHVTSEVRHFILHPYIFTLIPSNTLTSR
jgi:hypothetical protein